MHSVLPDHCLPILKRGCFIIGAEMPVKIGEVIKSAFETNFGYRQITLN